MADLTGMLQAAAGAAGGENLYIEDVFSTHLYTGNGSTQTITNGIDLDGEGGLVWIKCRNVARQNELFDTLRGVENTLRSNSTAAEVASASSLTAFNSNGFSVGNDGSTNANTELFASWTFRKAPKFFDVVTYTGTGSARTVAHNLGSVPGCIIVKRTDSTGDWIVYHRANTANPETDYLELNDTAATADDNTMWNDTAPTSTEFTVGTDADVNASAATYVAYLFAHDAGGFGDDVSENVITCGSFTTDGSGNATVTLGYEPQFVIFKETTRVTNWLLMDTMRGAPVGGVDARLEPNSSGAEVAGNDYFDPTPTGFIAKDQGTSKTSIYIAIRRGPMKTPTAGTEVFSPVARTGTGAAATVTGAGFPPDLALIKSRTNGREYLNQDRLRGNSAVSFTSAGDGDFSSTNYVSGFDVMDGVKLGTDSVVNGSSPETYINYFFRRAPKFMDVVCDTGTGSAHAITHNLNAVPELILRHTRGATSYNWRVYAGDETDYLALNTTAATADSNTVWNDALPTSTTFTVGTENNVNANGTAYVTYLFASIAGVSKIGTYTGNGTSVTVTTGFQPRFILVKRTDSTGNWIVGDSARGLVAADEPALFLNSSATETTGQDWVDVSATGFTVNATALNANVNTGTYIYLAIS